MVTAFFSEFWTILLALAPWLFLGAGLATILKMAMPPGFINRHIGRPGIGSIVKTILLGIPLPLCSCGAVPTAIGLKKDGASNGAVVGFLITTPETGADSFFVTASFLGWPLAIYRIFSAVVIGLIGGLSANNARSQAQADPPEETACQFAEKPSGIRYFLNYASEDLIRGIYRYLLFGVLVATVISLAIPKDFVSRIPVLQGIVGMLVMLAIASPLYVCSTGSVAIAAALVQAGLPLGSALVFLMAGPATNATTLASIYKGFGRKVTAIYLSATILGSIASGLLFQLLFHGIAAPAIMHHHHGAGPLGLELISMAAAAALLLLMARWGFLDARAWLRQRIVAFRAKQAGWTELRLRVHGMSCGKCAARVQRDLEHVAGVFAVNVNLEDSLVVIQGNGLDKKVLITAVEKAGYTVPVQEAAV
jgi:uncharacterized membrane protein YraQ (UPF0718 family)/copper chaperone CopZ